MNNNPRTTIIGNPGASDLSFVCKTGEGALFPSVFPFYGTLEHYSSGIVTKREIVTVTGRTGDVFTITRASQSCVQDESANPKTLTQSAYSFVDGDYFSQYFTKADLDLINTNIQGPEKQDTDCDTLTTGGRYGMTGTPVNGPKVGEFALEVYTDDTNRIMQIATYLDGSLFTRYYNGSVWSTWTGFTVVTGTTGGSSNAFTLTAGPTAYTTGMKVRFTANHLITGTATLNINSLGAKTIKKLGGTTNLISGDIQNGQVVEVVYNGTDFDMVSPVGQVVTPDVSTLLKSGLTAGENMSIGQAYRNGRGIQENIVMNYASDGLIDAKISYDNTLSFSVGCSIVLAQQSNIYNIGLQLKKVGSAAQVINLKIYSDATFTTLIGTSTNSINATTDLTTSYQLKQFNFSGINLSSGTYYILVNRVSGTNSVSNYIKPGNASFTGRTLYNINSTYGVSGTNINYTLGYEINIGYLTSSEDLNKKFKANSSSVYYNKVQGLVNSTVVADATFSGNIGGLQTGLTSLTEGELYYLKDDGTIGTTAGTTSVKIGRALSATEINFVPPL